MSNRQETACNACRRQKVSHSFSAMLIRSLNVPGERPICQRCQRLHKACVYRNSLAVTPTGTTRRRGSPISVSMTEPGSPLISIGQGDIVPLDMMRVYANKFFTHLHNPTLLAHKETFMTGITSGTVLPLLCLSIAAVSSTYARSVPH